MNLAQRIMMARRMGNSVCEDMPLPIGYGIPGPGCGQYDPVTDTGYYGEVAAADLITGDALASLIGLTAGSSQYSNAGWFKFYVGPAAACNRNNNGYAYVAYVAKMPNRLSISWDQINAVNAVYGNRREPILGMNCQVRLITGAEADPTDYPANNTSCLDDAGINSEWNELFYRIHEAVPDCSDVTIGMEGGQSTTLHGGPQNAGPNWMEFSNAETGVSAPIHGSASWAQESNGSLRCWRGYYGVASRFFEGANTNVWYGWRPVLQPTSLDPDSDPYDFSV